MRKKMSKEMLEKVLDNPIFNSAVWEYYKSKKITKAQEDDMNMLQKQLEEPSIADAVFSKSSFLVNPHNRDVLGWATSDEEKKHRKAIANKFIEYYLSEDFTVMELISQTGEIATNIAPHVKAVDCYEWSDDAVEYVRKESDGANNVEIYDMRLKVYHLSPEHPRKIIGFDLKSLPALNYIEKEYDFVYSYNAFKFFDIYETYHFLSKAANLLRPMGKIWINLHFDDSLEEHRAMFLEQYEFYKGDIYNNHGTNIQFVNRKAFAWVCDLCGLEIEEINEWGECTLVKRVG